ncbi:MAG: YabP/YqfC family sporulation protein [Oscillospiraceae bacterium]|nr:YabP/YqfC family sporulation protein [Oscillospiraceae bacterium]
MKLKPVKEKIKFKDVLREMFSKADKSSATSIAVDVDGGITVENFRRIVDYTKEKAVIETRTKTVYIYGEKLEIIFCDRHYATARGDIRKIEIFSKEV